MADYKAIRIIHAIMAINPNAKVNVWDNDIDRIDWTIEYWDETEKKDKTVTTNEISKLNAVFSQSTFTLTRFGICFGGVGAVEVATFS